MTKKILAALCLLAVFTPALMAQSPSWEIKLDKSLFRPTFSPDGSKLIFFDDDSFIQCSDAKSGKILWKREIKGSSETKDALFSGRFIGSDKVLIGNENRYEFLDAATGTVKSTLPIVGESWSDLVYTLPGPKDDWEPVKPYFIGDFGIFYFDEGFQIVDLKEQKIFYQSTCDLTKIKYERNGNVLMIAPQNGCDSVFFLDADAKKMAFRMDLGRNSLNSSLYHHFYIFKDKILFFTEDNILSIDVTANKISAIIPVDPDDPDYFLPVADQDNVYLLVSDEGKQKFYDGKTAGLLWETPEGKLPGITDQVTVLDNSEALFSTYDDDGKMHMAKVNLKNGNILWDRILFDLDGKYEPGHRKGSKLLANVASFLIQAIQMAGRSAGGRSGFNAGTGMYEYRPDPFYYSDRQAASKRASDLYNAIVSNYKSSPGYIQNILVDKDKAILLMGGRIYTELNKTERDDYDGEGLVTLNLKDGSTAQFSPFKILANADKSTVNAVKDLVVNEMKDAKIVVGANDVYIIRSGSVENFAFEKENIKLLNSSDSEINIVADHERDYFDYWNISTASTPAKKTLLARSDERNLVFQEKPEGYANTILIKDDIISAYRPMSGSVTEASFTNALWTMSEDDMDKLGLGSIAGNKTDMDSICGVRVTAGNIYLMGSRSVGCISADGKCKWSKEWEPELIQTRMGLKEVGNYLMFSSGSDTEIFRCENGCSVKNAAKHDISYSDVTLLVSPANNCALVIDTDEGNIYAYALQ